MNDVGVGRVGYAQVNGARGVAAVSILSIWPPEYWPGYRGICLARPGVGVGWKMTG
ncbi:MAG: hypothetical protein ACQSGP_15365 [Frankia sp.]